MGFPGQRPAEFHGDAQLAVNVIPKRSGDRDENSALCTPLTLTGTPDELDRELAGVLTEYVDTLGKFRHSLADAKLRMEEAVKTVEAEGKKKVEEAEFDAIDSVRKIGNIGAHMEKNVNLIVDVDPGESEKLLRLIEALLDEWYVRRHKKEELLASVRGIAEEKGAIRKAATKSRASGHPEQGGSCATGPVPSGPSKSKEKS